MYWWLSGPLSHPDRPLQSPAGLNKHQTMKISHFIGLKSHTFPQATPQHTHKRLGCIGVLPINLHSDNPKIAIISLIGKISKRHWRETGQGSSKRRRKAFFFFNVHTWEALIGVLSFLNKVSTDTVHPVGVVFNPLKLFTSSQLSSSSNHTANRDPNLPQLGCLWRRHQRNGVGWGGG